MASRSGTTTLATSLAKAGAASGARTLLIDLNFRKPDALARLKSEPDSGLDLIDAIEDRTALPRALKKFQGSETLSVLTCGAQSAGRVKLDLLASAKLDSLFEDLREQFSLIVVDTPPIGLVSDALPCMKRADRTLLVTTEAEAMSGRLQETTAALARKFLAVDNVIVTRYGGGDDPHAERMKGLLVADELADGKADAAWRKLFKGRWSKPWAQLAEGKRLIEASEI